MKKKKGVWESARAWVANERNIQTIWKKKWGGLRYKAVDIYTTTRVPADWLADVIRKKRRVMHCQFISLSLITLFLFFLFLLPSCRVWGSQASYLGKQHLLCNYVGSRHPVSQSIHAHFSCL